MTETDCCVSSLGAGLLIILVIGQVVYQRILTTKPLEDREFQGCTLCLHKVWSSNDVTAGRP